MATGDWRDDATVVRLTAKVHDLVQAAARRNTDTVVTIGTHLARIRARLEGRWLRWVDDNAPFGRSSANNYIGLAAWSQREPREFARLRHLGPAKLYVVAAAPPERVRGLKAGKAVHVPSIGRKKTIETMTPPELGSILVGDLIPPPVDAPPIAKVVAGVRSTLAELGAVADVMLARADEVDEDVVQEIRDELAQVLQRIDDAL